MVARNKNQKIGEVDRVYGILRDWLITARLRPGEFLSEADLATHCRTSRTPVREACTRLMQDRWLSRIQRKGFLVTPISVRDVVELYEFRKLLECFAAERVAETANHEQVQELKRLVEPETNVDSELRAILAANERFHLRLAELAGNQRVVGQLALTLSYVSRLDTLCTQTVPGWIGHGTILRAIERRQPSETRQAMAAHIDLSRDKMVKLFSS